MKKKHKKVEIIHSPDSNQLSQLSYCTNVLRLESKFSGCGRKLSWALSYVVGFAYISLDDKPWFG